MSLLSPALVHSSPLLPPAQWLSLLHELIQDNTPRFKHYSGLNVQSLLDVLRDFVGALAKSAPPVDVDAFVANSMLEVEWTPSVVVRWTPVEGCPCFFVCPMSSCLVVRPHPPPHPPKHNTHVR